MRIYDCFCFSGEINLLNLRLELYEKFIDYFVIVEANIDFRGNKKNTLINDEFLKKNEKIIYILLTEKDFVIDDPWHREIVSRNAIKKGLKNAKDDDLIIISDIDEIISPSKLPKIANSIRVYEMYWHRFFPYYINFVTTWKHASSFPFKYLNIYEPFDMKLVRRNFYDKKVIPLDQYEEIPEAGSHLSYFPKEPQKNKYKKILNVIYNSIKGKIKSFPEDHIKSKYASFDISLKEFKLLFYFGIDILGVKNIWGTTKNPFNHFPIEERKIIKKFFNFVEYKTFFNIKDSILMLKFNNFISKGIWRFVYLVISVYFKIIRYIILLLNFYEMPKRF